MLTKAQQKFLLRDMAGGDENSRLIYCKTNGDVTVARALQKQGVGVYIPGETGFSRRFKVSELGLRVRFNLLERRAEAMLRKNEE